MMQLTIESTDTFITIDGTQCRVWRGRSPGGLECFLAVHRIAVRDDRDCAEFSRELFELLTPDSRAFAILDQLTATPEEPTP